MLVDSHCHLDFKVLIEDLDAVLIRAKENDVNILQTICTKISEFDKIHSIANYSENIFCSVGNHPLNVLDEGVISAEEILKHTKKTKVIGIGETGLDYYYSKNSKKIQKESFIEHITAAQESSLPIIVHTRDADEDTVAILKKCMMQKKFLGLIHCFTASEWLAMECLDMGLYISASGIVTFKNAIGIQQTFKKVPIDKILIETDAPFLSPMPLRGKDNEPSYVKHTAKFMAELLKVEFEDFAKTTTNNFFNLFKKAKLK
jgi:TatD DNase family protein